MQFTDAVVLDGSRRTRDGYLVADAKVSRTGIQTYLAGEIGLTDRDPRDVIRVYRSEEEVFAADAMASLAFRPMTVDHPSEMVTADNWKKHAVGLAGGDVARDGQFVRVPLTLMDSQAIADFEAGRRELSVGYTCDLILDAGETPDGQAYDAVQRNIRANHIALCAKARGGPELRFGDNRNAKGDKTVATKTILVDGLMVEVTDAAEAAITKLQSQITGLTDAQTKDQAKIGELTAQIATKDGEIAGLTAKLKDAEVTPAKLQQLADQRAVVLGDAQKIVGETFDGAGKTEAEIRRAAVSHKLGDAAKDMSDDAIAGAFKALVPTSDAHGDPVRDVIRDGISSKSDQATSQKAYDGYREDLSKAWQTPAAA